jgi:hypothetical protein
MSSTIKNNRVQPYLFKSTQARNSLPTNSSYLVGAMGGLGIFRPKTTLIAVAHASRGFPEGITLPDGLVSLNMAHHLLYIGHFPSRFEAIGAF